MTKLHYQVPSTTISFVLASIRQANLFGKANREPMDVLRNQFQTTVGVLLLPTFDDIWSQNQNREFPKLEDEEFDKDLYEQSNTVELLYMVTTLNLIARNYNAKTASEYGDMQSFLDECVSSAYIAVVDGLFNAYGSGYVLAGSVIEVQKVVFTLTRPLMDSLSISSFTMIGGDKDGAIEVVNIADSTLDWVLNLDQTFEDAPSIYEK